MDCLHFRKDRMQLNQLVLKVAQPFPGIMAIPSMQLNQLVLKVHFYPKGYDSEEWMQLNQLVLKGVPVGLL